MSEYDTIAAQRPMNIEEAIPCMQVPLCGTCMQHDGYRAIFLTAYYIITLNVHAAIHQRADYDNPDLLRCRVGERPGRLVLISVFSVDDHVRP